jgi:hypothetical protein
MKKLALVFLLIAAGVFTANAQPSEGFQFGAGIRAALPIGDFADTHSFGVGGEVQGEFGFSDMFSGILTTGYTHFFGKTVTILGTEVEYDGVGLIPILAGVRVYPSPNFFIGAQAGYGILTGGGNSDGSFNYQPQVGYNGETFQVAVNYNALSKNGTTLSHIGLTAIFKFGGTGTASK